MYNRANNEPNELLVTMTISDGKSICGYTAPAFRSTAILLLAAFAQVFASPTAHGQGTTSGKGDYQAPTKPPGTQSVVPKSIYLTPKSDRLEKPTRKDAADGSRKANRQHVSPADDEPWVAEPEDDADDTGGQAAIEPLPEITVPFDPHVNAPKNTKKPISRKQPKARKSRKRAIDVAMSNGRLKLNRFQTLTMDMPHSECRKFPDIFIADYDLPRGAIDVLADNMLIVQKRICADNGAVMVTCYQNNATVSMRPAKPNDGCKR